MKRALVIGLVLITTCLIFSSSSFSADRPCASCNQQEFKDLFDTQLATLKDRGCPEQIVDMLNDQRDNVVGKALAMNFERDRIPFLPVIPRAYITLYSQMAMVRYKDKAGFVLPNHKEFTDVPKTPAVPYYVFDVEDGTAMLGQSAQDAEKLIKKQSRRGLTEIEVIALVVHTDVISRHNVDAIGSCGDSCWVPDLWMWPTSIRPMLGQNPRNMANEHWGAASCRNK